MHKEPWSVSFTFWLGPWLNASDEMELRVFLVLRNLPRLLLTHTQQWLSKLFHQVVHLVAEL